MHDVLPSRVVPHRPVVPTPAPAARHRRTPPAVLGGLALAGLLALGGCGGGDDATTTDQATSVDPRQYDAIAKSSVRNTLAAVESCATGTRSYARCTTAASLGPAGSIAYSFADDGRPDGGEVAVQRATRSRYRVLAVSPSGNRFAATKTPTGFIRSCTSKGSPRGGCRNGSW
ncbi:hypothetical protein AB0L40_21350 [Patulibacter sp. NPDC049589]|uniref:hypothetical protein n=1 Tax=Patulibacter sp. NPDC049589 TaxID=3154731 RepID=UPI003446F0E0